MKVLWIVNTIFPDAAIHIGMPAPIAGGWMYGLAADLAQSDGIRLAVATVYPGKMLTSFEINGIRYYLLPNQLKSRRSEQLTADWRKVNNDFSPDLVHIHGTEYGHGMAMMNAISNNRYIISIQGLISVYHRYYLAGMSTWDVVRSITIRDILRWNTLYNARLDFKKRGLIEKEYIRRATAVIGRTDWDKAHTQAINPEVNYHFCNESLRDEFYTNEKWSIDNCHRHTIFLSQATYPIKGLHQVLKAAALLKNEYPNILIKVAGDDVTDSTKLINRLKRGGYGRHIKYLINKLGLEKHIKFLGPLSATEMKQAYLRAGLFICPSSIENSPNSLGEAQILGLPCIASYCGGIPSMVTDGESALLYGFDEYELLATKIRSIFMDDNLCTKLSKGAIAEAETRHCRSKNVKTTIEIYLSNTKYAKSQYNYHHQRHK